jgi:site-specific recombinase XerD
MERRVELFAAIRFDWQRHRMPVRALARKYDVHRRTVRQAIASPVPPDRKVPERAAPVREAVAGWIDAMLREDLAAPRKQRHTARRVFERLADEHGAQVSYSYVAKYVARRRAEIAAEDRDGAEGLAGFVPQVREPGAEAEVDFGDVTVELAGQLSRCFLFAFRLSCSGKGVHRVYASQAQEAFLEGHVAAFEVAGGVPFGQIRYDNLSPAVAKVLAGRSRTETQRWLAFRAHSLLIELTALSSQFTGQIPGALATVSARVQRREVPERDLAALAVPLAGGLDETGSRWEPYRLLDPAGEPVRAAAEFFVDLQARGRSQATVRSYGMDLLRWFRFCWATGTPWDRATRAEARDFCRWMLIAGKPDRPHWRAADQPQTAVPSGRAYASSVRAHCETVLRSFYDYHLEAGTGPLINPFPLDRSRRGGRANAHHNPMEPFRKERAGLYRRRVPSRVPRSVPDEEFNEIFARLPSHRDRAMVAFYVSTGARASELLSVARGGADPGRQLITVTRKGSGELQELPASTDTFVWLRLYQLEMAGLIPKGHRQPLWWTLRRPARPLTYHAVHRMFERAGQAAGSSATLHALRHTAAYRMAEDPQLPLTDVQLVLGHAQLTTTQIYLTPRKEEVIRRLLAHHAEQARQAARRAAPPPAPGYRPETLQMLFGTAGS